MESFTPIHVLEIVPSAAIAQTQVYFCELRSEFGLYECRAGMNAGDYLKLSSGELERIRVGVEAAKPGVYGVAVVIRYTAGGEMKTVQSPIIHVGIVGGGADGQEYPDAEADLLAALRDSDTENRRAAAVQAGKRRTSAAVEELAKIAFEPGDPIAQEAIELLGSYGEGQAIQILLGALANPDPGIRAAVVAALGNSRNKMAIPGIAGMLEDPEVPLGTVLRALIKLRAQAEITRMLSHASPLMRQAAMQSLYDLGGPGSTVRLAEMLKDADAGVRDKAIKLLGETRGQRLAPEESAEALAQMGDLLDHPEAQARRSALRALGKLKPSIASARLIGALDDADEVVREEAAVIIGGIGDPAAVPDLRRALERGNKRAGYALAILEPPDINGLNDALSNPESKVRVAAIIGLETLGYRHRSRRAAGKDFAGLVIEILENLLGGDYAQKEVRLRAFKAINTIKGRGGWPEMW